MKELISRCLAAVRLIAKAAAPRKASSRRKGEREPLASSNQGRGLGPEHPSDSGGGGTKASSGIAFIGDLAQLSEGLSSRQQAVITGELIFATLQTSSPGPDFTRLAPRVLTPWFRVRNQKHMFLWVHNGLVAKAKDKRLAFAVDGVLRYGKRTKGRAIVFNGYRTSAGTYLHWYRFTNGELVDIQERVVPNDDARYETEMTSLLNNIAVESDTKLYWTDPLPCLRSEKLTFIGSDPFQRMRAVALARKAPAWKRFGPWLVPAAALTAYSWAMGSLWAEYAQAHAQYQTLAKSSPRAAESLEVLRARQAWLAAPEPMQSRIAPLTALFRTIAAHPTWQIQRIQLNAPAKGIQIDATAGYAQVGGPKAPDLLLTISLPKDDRKSPLDQAQAPLTELANATGLPLHVAAPPNGLTEQETPNGKLLFITIESSAQRQAQAGTQ